MYKIVYCQNDATLYERFPDTNSGVDEILELEPVKAGQPIGNGTDADNYYNTTYNSRLLLKFDVSNIISSQSFQCFLTIKATEVTELPISYTLYSYPVSGSWTNGTGYAHSLPVVTNGTSWNYMTSKATDKHWPSGSYAANVTGSYTTIAGGGNWYYNVSGSQTFNYENPDVRMDVTNIVLGWLSGSYDNNGFIIKYSDADEQSLDYLGNIKFFSKDSHTIYIPRLEFYWNDVVLSGTGSFTEVSSDSNLIYVKNLRETYTRNDKPIIRLGGRAMYPTQTYATSSNYLVQNRMPVNSYFEIQDSITYEKVVPSNTLGTKVSCDSRGNYIKLDMSSLMPERYYKLVFKCEFSDGTVLNIDNNYEFRVTVI